MTTENDPAGSAAATDETAPQSPQGDQTPIADAAPHRPPATEPVAEEAASDHAAPASQEQPENAAEEDESARSVPTGPSSESPLERSSTSAGQATVDAPQATPAAPPPRRVRLNPTVAPDVAKPIPSLRPIEPPPSTMPPATPSPPQPATSADAAPSQPVQPVLPADDVSEAQTPMPEPMTATQAAATANSAVEATEPPPRPKEPVALPGKNESLDADLEAELEAAMIGSEQQTAPAVDPSAALAEAAEAPLTPESEVKRGTKLTGTVASIHGDDMFLDFGLRVPGVLSRRQFGLRKQPMQGETLEVVVGRVDENEGLMHVNLPTGTSKVRGEWDALSVDQNVECLVTGTNKGGLEVSIGMLRGFMPASQVELGYVPDLNVYIGQKIKARISEVNPKRRKLVLSRRALLEEEREQSQQELFEKIEPGQQYTGRVRTLKDYGAFVDIGGADGLLHVAQISWSRINHPSEVLTEGEQIEVQVLSIDKEKKKISLGMRQLTQNPWKAAQSKYAQGAVVKGKVTRIENFGAFVELEDGVEGLVHISELDHKRVNKVTEVLRVGQEIEVQVLEVDPKKKRISLSLKALREKPEDPREAAESAPVKRQRSVDSLVGGIGKPTGGQLFGDPNKFGG